MTKLISFQGIIIKKKDINDSDRLLTVFTSSFGKLNILIKGINKSKRRNKTACDVLNYSSFIAYKKDNNYLASTVDSINSYSNIKVHIDKIQLSLYIFSLLNNILNFEERKTKLFNLTEKSLEYINKEDSLPNIYILLLFYMYNLIVEEGINFTSSEGDFFSIENSYLGEKNFSDSLKLNLEEKFILENLISKNSKNLLNSNSDIKNVFSVLALLENYLNFHLELSVNFKLYTGVF